MDFPEEVVVSAVGGAADFLIDGGDGETCDGEEPEEPWVGEAEAGDGVE